MKYKKIVIIGMGLIGGSIAKALLDKDLADEVVGVCRRQSSLDRAVKEKALTAGYVNNYEEATAGADIIFIATPVNTTKKVLDDLAGVISDPGVLVTDVGSTKKEIVDHARKYAGHFSFVGAHPLAGSEKKGVEYARADLFQRSLCVLTRSETTVDEDIEKLRSLWQALGAKVEVTTPEEHDRILAFTSHLPHIAAYALSGVQDPLHYGYMSTGFGDATRIASSDPALWSDIFMTNSDNVLNSISRFKELLSGIEEDIRQGRQEALRQKLEECKRLRDGFIQNV